MKDIPEFEGLYAVTEDGKVWSYPRSRQGGHHGLWLKPWGIGAGYHVIALRNGKGGENRFLVHRLVAMAYLPNPNNFLEVNHKDGNRINNKVDNLEWCTAKHNSQHARDTGLSGRGETHYSTSLSNGDVFKIRELRKQGMMYKEIAPIFGISIDNAWQVVNKTWRHI